MSTKPSGATGSTPRENRRKARSLGTKAYLQLGKRFRRDLVPNLIQQSEKIILTRLPECQPIQRH
jgi:hypothetical protein